MRPLLKPDPHILLKAIEDPTNPIGMSMIFKKNVLKMPGTEHSHSVFSEEFRALRHDLLPTPLLSLDSFYVAPSSPQSCSGMSPTDTWLWKVPFLIPFENTEATLESFIIILTFKIHKCFFEIKNNSWLRDQAWFFHLMCLFASVRCHGPVCLL